MTAFFSRFSRRGPEPEDAARQRMVETQIRKRGITDERVLAAMVEVPRHLFVGPEQFAEAHDDNPLPIGFQQTISQPYIVALMLESLKLLGSERVLEIGTGCGYETALLSKMAAEIVSIERVAELAKETQERLKAMGIRNVEVHVADGTLGCSDRAPYDGIVVTAASPSVPPALTAQLADGGRLVIPVGSRHDQMLTRVTRRGGALHTEEICPCRFVPLIGAEGFDA